MTKYKGLTNEEAKTKLSEFGPNILREVKKNTPGKILLRQVRKNYIVYLLSAAAIVSFVVGKDLTAYTIFAVIFVVVSAGFIQEFRAERAIASLKQMLMPVSRVMRNGREIEVPSSDIVPGDIVLLRAGEKVPADALILDESEVRLDESVLTGEAKEVKKTAGKNEKDAADENKVFMGTFVLSGRCVVEVLHTGMNTKFGNIAGMVSTTEKSLPLQGQINKISAFMVIAAGVVAALVGITLLLRADAITGEFITGTLVLMIAVAVSAFPEGFPLVLIATLANGASKMAKKNAIVNRMSVIESLGEVTTICTDKTGTITTGEMTVKKIVLDGVTLDVTGSGFTTDGEFKLGDKIYEGRDNLQLQEFLNACVLCNDAKIEKTDVDHKYIAHGSTTEASLLILAGKRGIFLDELDTERVEELPFTSERKMMSVLSIIKGKRRVYAKGAPEVILSECKYYLEGNKKEKMTDAKRNHFLEENKSLTRRALRTLAFSYKDGPDEKKYDEDDLIFLGITGMEDPARPEAAEAIAACERAGIKVKMITGDSRDTAVAVAKEVGITGKVLTGEELSAMTDEELKDEVKEISLFVRVNPEHKLRIVSALKAHGEIVAMTGDGVNDAPALKDAHIGIAMGIKGTDVSRSVADLVLKDDNFATIVVAISEGRTIFSNIRKFISYQLSCNFAELTILLVGVIAAPFFGWEVPLLAAIQILFMNLVTSDFPALTLGFNPSSKDVLRPRALKTRKAGIIDRGIVLLIVMTGLIMSAAMLGIYYISFNILGNSSAYARTEALVALILIEIVTAFSFRSFRKEVFNRSPFVNKYLFGASLASIIITALVVYTPLNVIFETTPIGWGAWGIAFAACLILLLIYDIGKMINKKIRFLPTH